MTSEPLDTRVTNGRFVGPGAPADSCLTIHDGVIVDAPDQDVWRTVNASGHLVLPGLIQPALVDVEGALSAVRGGTTSARGANAGAVPCVDVLAVDGDPLEVIVPDAAGRLTDAQWERLLGDDPVHFQAPAGTEFPVVHFLYHEGHVERSMSLERIVAVTSSNVATAASAYPRKGCFAAGSDGDLFVFDPDARDPYSDVAWPGRVIFSLLRGAILLYNGQIHTTPGYGVRIE